MVGQGDLAGNRHHEVGHVPGGPQHDRPGGQMTDGVGVKHFPRDDHRPRPPRPLRIDFPGRHHRGVGAAGGVVVLEAVTAGREFDVVPAPRPGTAHRAMVAWGGGHDLAVDQQEAAILAGGDQSIVPGLFKSIHPV